MLEYHASEFEHEQFSTGVLPEWVARSKPAYVAHSLDWDIRRAEALSQITEADPFDEVKILIKRGKLKKAKELVRKIEGMVRADDSHTRSEVALEQARLAAFEWDWIECVNRCDEAFSYRPNGLSRLTLHQVRALAFLELGFFDRAWADLDICLAFCRIYPHCPSAFYAQQIRIKLIARTQSLETAKRELAIFWRTTTRSPSRNWDQLVVLLRLEGDLARLSNEDPSKYYLASAWAAEKCGDDLFRALGLFESGTLDQSELQALEAEFPRVAKIKSEISCAQAGKKASVTAQDMARLTVASGFRPSDDQVNLDTRALVLLNQGITVSTDTSANRPIWQSLEEHPQLLKAMNAFSLGRSSREEFFYRVWDLKNFHPERHDLVLRRLCYRIRNRLSLDIEASGGELQLNSTFFA